MVIPVSRDRRLSQCLASIDEDVEVVVVLNNHPTPEVRQIAAGDDRVRIVDVPGSGCNLARVFNLGIVAASNDYVLLMNSDCLLPPGLIRRIVGELRHMPVVKARVRFRYRTRTQELVARCRYLFHEYYDGGGNLFGPGLAFDRSIRRHLGGYYFDEAMGWGEDGELSRRIHAARIPYLVVDGHVEHAPEGMLHDLKIARRIGNGRRQLHMKQGVSAWRMLIRDGIDTLIDRRRRFRQAWTVGGFPLACYYALWRMAMYSGYYFRSRRRSETWN